MVGRVGIEPTSPRLRSERFAVEACGLECLMVGTKGFEPLPARFRREDACRYTTSQLEWLWLPLEVSRLHLLGRSQAPCFWTKGANQRSTSKWSTTEDSNLDRRRVRPLSCR